MTSGSTLNCYPYKVIVGLGVRNGSVKGCQRYRGLPIDDRLNYFSKFWQVNLRINCKRIIIHRGILEHTGGSLSSKGVILRAGFAVDPILFEFGPCVQARRGWSWTVVISLFGYVPITWTHFCWLCCDIRLKIVTHPLLLSWELSCSSRVIRDNRNQPAPKLIHMSARHSNRVWNRHSTIFNECRGVRTGHDPELTNSLSFQTPENISSTLRLK